jgi:hypothetical protein
MVTFDTQEEFEDAVMEVVASRLEILLEAGGLPVNATIQATLLDSTDDSVLHSSYV